MTPLVLGLATVVVVILIAVAVGMRHVRNEERADLTDQPADRGTGRGGRDQDWARNGQRSRRERLPARSAAAARSRGPADRAGQRGDRGLSDAARGQAGRRYDGSAEPAGGYDDRDDEPDFRTAQRQEARSQARGRQPRGRRDDDGDWPSTEWDKLSDADYWKEVASDRPLVTTARAAQPVHDSHPVLPGQHIDAAGPGAGRAARLPRRAAEPLHGPDRQRDAAPLPARGAPQPAVAGRAHDFLSAPAAGRAQDPIRPELARPPLGGPAAPRPEAGRPGPARAMPAAQGPAPRVQRPAAPMPADDDPLTSPSFPKIVTSDSRSYHSGRPAVPAEPAGYGAPTAQFASYDARGPRPADGRGVNGYDRALADSSSATTAPRSYRPDAQPVTGNYGMRSLPPAVRPAGQGAGTPAGPPEPARPPAPSSRPATASPAGNPYGSYVSSDLPGYPDGPTSGYLLGHSGAAYPGYSAGQENGLGGSHYRHNAPAGESAPPLGSRAGNWYPAPSSAMPPAPAPGGSAPPSPAGLHDRAGLPGHANNGNGHPGSSGYPLAPHTAGRREVAGYPSAGYGDIPEPPGYPAAGRHSARRPQDAARYLPPEFYGRDGYAGQ